MPWRDWQFWIVTAVAIGGVWAIVRQFLPRRWRRRSRGRRISLTIGGEDAPRGGRAPRPK